MTKGKIITTAVEVLTGAIAGVGIAEGIKAIKKKKAQKKVVEAQSDVIEDVTAQNSED